MFKLNSIFLFLVLLCSCSSQDVSKQITQASSTSQRTEAEQDSIIKKHLEEGARTKGLYSRAWQEELDKGLAKDSTIAYLWQQKAMPMFKQGKYEAGMVFLDKAVKYKPERYLDYRAFIKCIFAKTYKAAIKDFEACKTSIGNSIVMDHSYDFYIGLCKLQLNEFDEAEQVFEKDIANQTKTHGADWVHHLDLFYLGISKYEVYKYEEAIDAFDRALMLYPEFSDAQYYKAICIGRLGDKDAANELIDQAVANGQQGYTINEDNAIYERYPYQKRW